jgi:hypothetical protein
MDTHAADNPQKAASDAGDLIQSVGGAADPATSTLGRVGGTLAAARIATRVLPAAWRFIKRHPVNATLAIVAVASAIYLIRAPTHRTPPPVPS